MSSFTEKYGLDKVTGVHIWSLGIGAGVIGFLTIFKKLGLLYQLFHKADPHSRKHGGNLVAEVLKAHDVKFVFTLVGGHISPILVGCEKIGIKVIDTRHEATAVFAADAVARLTGKVGVACVTAGPGLTNTITAVKNAQMAESPLVLMGGAAAILLKGRGALQDIDQMSLFQPLCKYCATIHRVADIVPVMKKAIQVAMSDTPGPVFVEFPIDVLYPYQVVSKEFVGMKKPGNLFQKVINWYLQNHLDNIFAGAFDTRDVSPLKVSTPMATDSQVRRCVELLRQGQKPVFVLGSQAMLPPTSANTLKTAMESVGIPCFLGGMARGLLGRNSPYHIRQKRAEALKEADVIVLAGAVCDFRLSYGRVLSKRAKIIAVNRNREQLFKNSDMFWKPNVAIEADVGSFLVNLCNALRKTDHKVNAQWLKKLQEVDLVKEEQNMKMAESATDQHLNPLNVLYALEKHLPDDCILVADGGDFVASAAYILRPRGPLRWLDPGAFGTLGVGGGFALGAKLACPNSQVWILYGDGSLGYSVAEFDTFVRHKLPVIALVGNDACWTQISREQVPMLGSNIACQLAFCEYQTVAEGYGGKGIRLDRTNEDAMVGVIEQAQSEADKGNPVLINCLIGKTSFREGSISV